MDGMADSTSSGRLAGKVAIVTGAGSGFGEGIATLFAKQGAKVVVADINESAGKRVAETMSDSMVFMKCNVCSAADWEEMLKATFSKWGQIDILVNNAGTSYRNKPTASVTEAEFDLCFNVNVKSIFLSVNAIVPYFKKAGGGCIVNIASTGATRPRPGLVWYNASKGAVYNATKGLAGEYGPLQIRVNSVCPLLAATGLFEHFSGVTNTPENQAKLVSNVPMGRLCTPADVASACLFFASEDAKFVTGINMEVDGGKCIG